MLCFFRPFTQIWDAEHGGLIRTYHDVTTSEITGIDTNASGRKVIVTDSEGGVSVFNFATGRRLKELPSHAAAICGASAASITTGAPKHEGGVFTVALLLWCYVVSCCADADVKYVGEYVVTGGLDGSIRLCKEVRAAILMSRHGRLCVLPRLQAVVLTHYQTCASLTESSPMALFLAYGVAVNSNLAPLVRCCRQQNRAKSLSEYQREGLRAAAEPASNPVAARANVVNAAVLDSAPTAVPLTSSLHSSNNGSKKPERQPSSASTGSAIVPTVPELTVDERVISRIRDKLASVPLEGTVFPPDTGAKGCREAQ